MTAELGEREEDSVGSLPGQGGWNKSHLLMRAQEQRRGEMEADPAQDPLKRTNPVLHALHSTALLPTGLRGSSPEPLTPLFSHSYAQDLRGALTNSFTALCLFPLSCAFLTTHSFFVSSPSFKHLSGSGLLHLYDEKSHLP